MKKGKGITFKGFVPYYEVEEVKLEKRPLNRSVVSIKRKDGREIVVRIIAGKGMGITREEYIELFKKLAEKIPVKVTIEIEESFSERENPGRLHSLSSLRILEVNTLKLLSEMPFKAPRVR